MGFTASDSGGGSLSSVCMTALGIKNYLTYGQQGGGYCAPDATHSVPFQSPAAIFGYPITRFLMVMGYNDWQYSFTALQIQTAAAAYYDAIHAQFPNAKIYAVTTLNEVAGGDPAALGIAAAAVGRSWVSVIKGEGNYLTGTGHVGATTGVGNADFVTSTDAIHPSPYGHTYYGLRIAQDLLALRAATP